MSKIGPDKLSKIPIIKLLVKFGKSVKVPGLQGMSLYDLIEMYFTGILKGALTTRAGGISYSFFMAIFPFLLFVLTLIPYISIDGFQEGLFSLIAEILPPKTFEVSQQIIEDILVNQRAGLLSFGFVTSMFLMTNGVNAVFGGFEYSYHVKEVRNVVRAYIISFGMSLLIVFFLVITVAMTIFYQLGLDTLQENGWLDNELFWLKTGRSFLFLLMIFTIVSLLYRYGTTSGKYYRFFSAGTVLTTLLSILTFYLFSYYVIEFSKYNELYGSIGTLLIIMVFIWLNAIILLLGFELNASIYSLQSKNKSDTSIE